MEVEVGVKGGDGAAIGRYVWVLTGLWGWSSIVGWSWGYGDFRQHMVRHSVRLPPGRSVYGVIKPLGNKYSV